jgi:nitroreductase
MDALLAIASKRDLRDYDGNPLAPEEAERILDAGRLAGSARNRQPWRFVVVETGSRKQLAATVYVPQNILTAGLVVALLAPAGAGFDCGRAAQNMMLAAWAAGLASCPNGIADREGADALLAPAGEETVHVVLSFGRPSKPRPADSRDVAGWSASANRKPLAELVSRV